MKQDRTVAKTLLLSGFDLWAPELPDDAQILLPPFPLPELEHFRRSADQALEDPVDGEPLVQMLRPGSKVSVVIDDFSLPVPPMARDCRREMLESVLDVLQLQGVRVNRVAITVANGLSRQWKETELAELLGPRPAPYQVASHDAEAIVQLSRMGEEPEGPVEVNRALTDADLVIYINVVSMPLMASLFGLIHGTAGYRTARFLSSAQLLEGDAAPLVPGSAYHRISERIGVLLTKSTRIVQLSAVLNTDLWSPAIAALVQSEGGLTRRLQVWNALPSAVRHRAARLLRANYRPIAVLFGSPGAVGPRALQTFYRQHEVSLPSPARILLFGLPDQGPASVHAAQNPVLAANLALGYVANLFTERPILDTGGAIIFANPLAPVFDRRFHLPHEEFYEKVLRIERDPVAIHERFEAYFAGRPEFVVNYQRRFAFHGTHPLYAWYLCTPARRRAGRIIVAHGDPRACARLGFTPARDVEDALLKAREFLGEEHPST
ncbi:MAG TPA: lactate racemase domain-containing protein, partial [Myxococcaceae bacterium]|nr:lactate racemase domain-containing protein [Myxococcaceae bacterium]